MKFTPVWTSNEYINLFVFIRSNSHHQDYNMKSALVIIGFIAVTTAQHGHHYEEEEHKDLYDEPHYKYEYKVDDHHTGDFKGHSETREGDVVKGFYMLREADGTMREVHYTADKINGFNAIVKRSGTPIAQPEHEQPKYQESRPKNVYQARPQFRIYRQQPQESSQHESSIPYKSHENIRHDEQSDDE